MASNKFRLVVANPRRKRDAAEGHLKGNHVICAGLGLFTVVAPKFSQAKQVNATGCVYLKVHFSFRRVQSENQTCKPTPCWGGTAPSPPKKKKMQSRPSTQRPVQETQDINRRSRSKQTALGSALAAARERRRSSEAPALEMEPEPIAPEPQAGTVRNTQ